MDGRLLPPAIRRFAARLAEQAARVSHDGAAVEAAKLWAAMEAEASSPAHRSSHRNGPAFIPRDGAMLA